MIHIFVNALAASAGGGLTYVRNVIPHIAARADVRATVLMDAALHQELRHCNNVKFLETPSRAGVGGRFWFEQRRLPAFIRQSAADVLLSTGNFALWNSPVPQILLSRNALYTSSDFMNDLRRRGDFLLWLDTELKAVFAKTSIRKADVTIAPSEAFAEELRRWTGKNVLAIHHGFDGDTFAGGEEALPPVLQQKLAAAAGGLRLLFVSHYNYYRNFETLIRGLALLRDRLAPRKVRLILTCQLRSDANPGSYHAHGAARLVREFGLSENVIELGSVPYRLLHHVYRAADIYLTAAYAESFAHPLVEAMSSGLPIVASDLAVHREICGTAAAYFDRFSPEDLAHQVEQKALSGRSEQNSEASMRRSRDFSWRTHVEQIVAVAQRLLPGTDG